MNLQEMLGEAFHEGMSIEEINTALSGKKFADLSTGQYVDANKYNAEIKAKDAELARKTSELNAKMTDAEKAAASVAADKARIQELEALIQNQTVSSTRDKVEALTGDLKSILEIKNDNNEYSSMLNVLSNVDTEKARETAIYINKLVKDSYEKGKKDATKNNLGNFSKDVGKQGSTGGNDEVGSLGKTLAATTGVQKVDSNLYFK